MYSAYYEFVICLRHESFMNISVRNKQKKKHKRKKNTKQVFWAVSYPCGPYKDWITLMRSQTFGREGSVHGLLGFSRWILGGLALAYFSNFVSLYWDDVMVGHPHYIFFGRVILISMYSSLPFTGTMYKRCRYIVMR